jgi:hypothetical protein
MSPVAIPPHQTSKNALNFSAEAFTRKLKAKSSQSQGHAIESESGDNGDGIRTPRPMALTPSPPMSRTGSSSRAIAGENGGMAVDDEEESEGELGLLLRTIDFAARVSSDHDPLSIYLTFDEYGLTVGVETLMSTT